MVILIASRSRPMEVNAQTAGPAGLAQPALLNTLAAMNEARSQSDAAAYRK